MGRLVLPLGLAALLHLNPLFAQNNVVQTAPAVVISQNEQASALTLEQAKNLAIEANPSLAIARRELEAVAAARIQAGVFQNPQISMDVEDTRPATRTTTYTIGQPFELGGKRGARIESAERARDVADAELSIRIAEVFGTVSQTFNEVLTAQERLRLANDSMKLATRGLDVASKRVLAGKISPVEETRARVAVSAAKIELDQASSDLNNARRRLAALWGNPTPNFVEVRGNLDLLPLLPDLNNLNDLLNDSPQFTRSRLEVRRTDAVVKLAETKRYPDITISGGVQKDSAARSNIGVVGLAINIPIFDRNQGGILEAQRRADKARDEQFDTEVRMRSELAQAHQRLKTALNQAKDIRSEILPSAQSALNATTTGFELGKFSFLEVLDAQRTLFSTRIQYIQALSEVQRAVSEIETMIGPQMTPLAQSQAIGDRK
ncbi:TolC family protein [Oxalicibacterium faecigallinarum]|uniref:Outer membrane protein CzcC n=1 Tax=Oxalicibacterium faecigallinarum TaxID=573741 RepID=A0A8J3F1I5_9BURK|nr:TolC family protein [Oxalicibacterium faecigallinarum]GGI16999.1 outer membrane protein CzcC [Oxalicibacterium faecigallinarum]